MIRAGMVAYAPFIEKKNPDYFEEIVSSLNNGAFCISVKALTYK